VRDLRVINAMPRDQVLDHLLPYLADLRVDLQLQLDTAADRLRQVEVSLPMKVDKEFVDAFFRKIRMALHETNEKMVKVQAGVPGCPTRDEIDEQIQEALRTMGPHETTVAGKTSYACLLCGSKRSGVTNAAPGQRGRVFKGRAWPAVHNQALPPLADGE